MRKIIAAPKGFYKGKSETFKGFEFVDQLVAHLPPRRVQLVRRYGVYAGKVRNQWQRRPGIYRFAPGSWQEGHPSQPQIIQETLLEKEEPIKTPDAWSKLRKQSWARLLQKVYDVDPFICPRCQGKMSVVAVIEDPKELGKIIDWAGREQSSLLARATGAKKQALPSGSTRAPPELILATV